MSFASFIKMYPAVGWIRGDVETAAGALAEINDLRKELDVANAKLAAARISPPPGTEGLAQGQDSFDITAYAETHVRGSETDDWGSWIWKRWTGNQDAKPTWDALFSALGPSLLDEAEQKALRSQVNAWFTRRYGSRFRAAVRKDAEAAGDEVVAFKGTKLQLSEDDFGTLIVQLKALGLIQRSERKRSVSDKGAYWTLSPFGDTHLTTLRAIHRTGAATDTENSGEDEEEEE